MMTHHLLSAVDLVVGAKPRWRSRKPSLAHALKEAEKAGRPVKVATITPDGSVSINFGAPDAPDASGNELDKWMAKRNAH
jgi:hypothetical protein